MHPTAPARFHWLRGPALAALLAAALQAAGCLPSAPPAPAPEAAAPAPAPADAAPPTEGGEIVATLEPELTPFEGPAAQVVRIPDDDAPAEEREAFERHLLERWDGFVDAARDRLHVGPAMEVAALLKEYGSDGLNPILDTLAEDPGDPHAKMLVAVVLTHIVSPDEEERLAALTQPGVEVTGRACAATLISFLDTDTARARATELLKDSERRVRVAALIALLMTEDEGAIALIAPTLDDPETTLPERQQILASMPDSVAADHLDRFAAALGDTALADHARARAVAVIGQLGGPEHVAGLDAIIGDEAASPQLRARATDAREAIRARAE